MVSFDECAVDDVAAHDLLTEYFTSRAIGFTGGTYRTVYPDPVRFTRPDGVFLVVRDESGAAVGCGGIRRLGPRRFEVKHLYLRPETRGRGWGSRFLRELESRAIELGGDEVVLDTNSALDSASKLYRSAGYADVEAYNDNPNANVWLRKFVGDSCASTELPQA